MDAMNDAMSKRWVVVRVGEWYFVGPAGMEAVTFGRCKEHMECIARDHNRALLFERMVAYIRRMQHSAAQDDLLEEIDKEMP